jgi:mRNA interferase RelE/StbE
LGLSYRIEYLESVVAVDIPRLSKAAQRRIKQAIELKLFSHPIEFGKPLRYSLKGARRLRVGDFRVIYTIEADKVVLIVKIGHRRDVYDK